MLENKDLFEEKELKYLHDINFLITKREILKKIRLLLKQTENTLYQEINTSFKNHLPNEVLIKGGKISKGENYRALPFLILDYPRLFKPDNIFTFRTMFWWGNFFSCTLHLQGKLLDHYREALEESYKNLFNRNIFIGVAENPWEYTYSSNNYILIDEIPKEYLLKLFKDKSFIKLSRYIKVEEYRKLPSFSKETMVLIFKALKIQ